ncbi:UbiA family prenyltransferase [Nocardia iowensis]|uniref:UbiA family prenyltransferase n=1 Tax=Nocardia iowensis TaxID=204891 RepID=A0ABX8RM60_NOCIO|nr:UbiA family prenyltransferase [Nocardia iowensis]QXN90708.1 UbiA family prenyltransferase [Nocardia iowensis]
MPDSAEVDSAILSRTAADIPRPTDRPDLVSAARVMLLGLIEARPGVQVMYVLRFIVGGMLSQPADLDIGVGIGCAAWFCAIACAYIWNGYSDIVADRINGSTRPLAAGRLRPAVALRIATSLAAVSVLSSIACSISLLLHTIGALVLGYAYSFGRHALKRSPYGVTVTVTLIGLLTFDAGRVAFGGSVTVGFVAFATSMVLWMVVGGVVKDLDHLPGDIATGRRPLFAQVDYRHGCIGVGAVAVLPAACLVSVAAATPLPLHAPAGGLMAGALVLCLCLRRGSGANTARARRRPYRTFMYTQYLVHLGCVAEFRLIV